MDPRLPMAVRRGNRRVGMPMQGETSPVLWAASIQGHQRAATRVALCPCGMGPSRAKVQAVLATRIHKHVFLSHRLLASWGSTVSEMTLLDALRVLHRYAHTHPEAVKQGNRATTARGRFYPLGRC